MKEKKWLKQINCRQVLSIVLSTSLLITAAPLTGKKEPVQVQAQENSSKAQPALQAVYDFPANNWSEEATQLGNGFLGAMVFGGVGRDRIQINEHTLWSGGPGMDSDYNGGNNDNTAEQNHAALKAVREELQEVMTEFTNTKSAYFNDLGELITNNYPSLSSTLKSNVNSLKGNKDAFGSYQTLGDIANTQTNTAYSDYKRVLDLDKATATVTYNCNGVNYKKEYWISNPKNIMAIRITADEDNAISNTYTVSSSQPHKTISAEDGVITMTGRPDDHTEDGDYLKFAQQVKVIPEGGTMTTSSNSVTVQSANSVTVYMTAGTNYQQCMDDSFDYFSDEDPLDKVKERIAAAEETGYDTLYKEHLADYQELFHRVKLNLNNVNQPDKTTDELLSGYNDTNSAEEDRYFEMLYYQFGRYLLIASSREGSLPANLQGIWADGLSPAWDSDYHTNINIQMNYWLAEQTNLSECHEPLIDNINSLVPRGAITAQTYHYNTNDESKPVRGWTTYHENNIWGNTAPAVSDAFYFPAGAAWMCQDIWEKYAFTLDKDFLSKNYETLLGAALFWLDNLVEDERDGTLVSSPAWSPEHGEYSLGTTADQSIIWDVFENTIQASEVLGRSNDSEIQEIKAAQAKLSGPQIGLGEQFMEWKDEITLDITGDGGHRHVNHLFGLHPGKQIVAGRSEQDDAYVDAMKKTLNTRGDGGTGWSKAWKINFWARLRDGDRAHKLVEEIISGSTYKNLFDTHPPFQIDGNFGATAGMTEMLLQSQGDSIDLMAAMPKEWSDGNVTGLRARGNVTVGMEWANSKLTSATLTAGTDSDLQVKYHHLGVSDAKVVNSQNQAVEYKVVDTDTLSINAKSGETYTILYNTSYEPDAAYNVIDLIKAIGSVEFSKTCLAKLDAARNAYDLLSEEQKKLVTNYEKLVKAENDYDNLTKQLLQNGECESTNYWDINGDGTLGLAYSTIYEGSHAINISQRNSGDDAPSQDITDKIVAGGKYELSVALLYKAADNTDFTNPQKFTINLITPNGKLEMLSGSLEADSWTKLEGTFTLPKDTDISSAIFTIETENALKLFFFDAVSMIQVEDEEANKEAAAPVIQAINNIGTVEYTEQSKSKIETARTAYQALTRAQRKLVTNYETLMKAELAYRTMETNRKAADTVIQLIQSIGTVSANNDSKAKIEAARTAYHKLTDDQKKLVSNYNLLTAAETQYKNLTASATSKPNAAGDSASNTKSLPVKGSVYTVKGLRYKVLVSSSASKQVSVVKAAKKTVTKVSIPATVTIAGYKFKVTQIAKKAFYNNKKLKQVKIGSNIKRIGSKAFYGDKKLKNIVIQSKLLKKVETAAFKKTPTKLTVKVPSKKVKIYKKLFKKAGMKKTAKIKK